MARKIEVLIRRCRRPIVSVDVGVTVLLRNLDCLRTYLRLTSPRAKQARSLSPAVLFTPTARYSMLVYSVLSGPKPRAPSLCSAQATQGGNLIFERANYTQPLTCS